MIQGMFGFASMKDLADDLYTNEEISGFREAFLDEKGNN
jgi:hypothetical protein